MNTDCEKTVSKIMRRMPGKCHEDGMVYLCELANELKTPGLFIDLGTYYGRSAMVMLQGSLGNKMNRQVISIDNYSEGVDAKDPDAGPPPDFFRVKAVFKCRPRAHLVYGDTATVPMLVEAQDVAMVFVDCDHREKHLRKVVAAWKPLVHVGGVMAFDDYGSERWPDVAPVVDELMADWEKLDVRGSVAAFRRPEAVPEDVDAGADAVEESVEEAVAG